MKDIILKTGTHINVVTSKSTQRGAIPGTSLEKFVTTLLKNPTCCAKYVTLTKGAATGIAASGSVTLEYPAGDLTIASQTIGAGSSISFTFNSSFIKADSVILAAVNDTTGSGILFSMVDNIAAGSCTIVIYALTANTGTVTVSYGIF
jgi:hypothetical protein